MATVKEKEFLILEVDKKNKNHRTYPKSLCEKWIGSEKMKEGEGYDVEYAVEDGDYEYEFLKEETICGNVTKLRFDGNKLFGTVKFKIDSPFSDKIYKEEGFTEKVTIVPKGKGAVKNQMIQDDYELYGFNLILVSESSFLEDVPATAEVAAK